MKKYRSNPKKHHFRDKKTNVFSSLLQGHFLPLKKTFNELTPFLSILFPELKFKLNVK